MRNKNHTRPRIWRKFLALAIDFALFLGLVYISAQFVLPHIISCNGKFCGIEYLIYSVPVIALIATIFNLSCRRTIGDICLRIKYLNNDGTPITRPKVFAAQLIRYFYIGIFLFIAADTEWGYKIADSFLEPPRQVYTQEMADKAKQYNHFVPAEALIVSQTEFPAANEQYLEDLNKYYQKQELASQGITFIFFVLFSALYLLPFRQTGAPLHLWPLKVRPVKVS